MTIIRITNLSQMNPELLLKPVSHQMNCKQFWKLARNPARRVYYFKRRSKTMPPLFFEEGARVLEHQYVDNVCQLCGQAKPASKAEEVVEFKQHHEAAIETAPVNAGQGRIDVTLKQLDLLAEGKQWNVSP